MPNAGDITGLLALIGSAMAIWIAWKKAPAEIEQLQSGNHKTAADAIAQYIGALNQSAEQVRVLSERVAVLEKQVETAECEIAEVRRENDLLRDWSTRLAHQVQSLGAVPVEMQKAPTKPIKTK